MICLSVECMRENNKLSVNVRAIKILVIFKISPSPPIDMVLNNGRLERADKFKYLAGAAWINNDEDSDAEI